MFCHMWCHQGYSIPIPELSLGSGPSSVKAWTCQSFIGTDSESQKKPVPKMFGQWFLIPIFWNKCLSGSFHDSSFRCFSLSSFVFRGMRPQNEAMARSTAVMTSFPPRNGRWEARCYADSPSSAARCFFPHGYWIVLGLFKVFFVIFPMDNSPFGSIWGVYKDICFTFWGPRKQIWIFVEQVYWISQDLWIQESLLKTYAFFCSIPDTSTGGFCEEPTITEKIEKDWKTCFHLSNRHK